MTTSIDQTIAQVDELYRSVTGRPVPPSNGTHAPIPPEVDAARYVEEQLERLANAAGDIAATTTPAATAWAPPMSAWEDDDSLILAIALPGVVREAIDVAIADRVLTISGRSEPRWGERRPALGVHVDELRTGAFRRSVVLPPRARTEEMSARMQDGVLEIRIPCARQRTDQTRSIPVA
jgi:HSP20 family protein